MDRLADEEITARSAEFIGYYYFTNRGLLGDAFERFEHAMSHGFTDRSRGLNINFPVYFGTVAALHGQFFRAVGVLDSAWRRALSADNPVIVRFCRASLGTVLLLMGKRREAREHLEWSLADSKRFGDTITVTWAQRGLAYYWFLEDDLSLSYDLLKPCLVSAIRMKSPRPFFSFPGVLEMLDAYQCAGFEPIPGIPVDQEIRYALGGMNLLQTRYG